MTVNDHAGAGHGDPLNELFPANRLVKPCRDPGKQIGESFEVLKIAHCFSVWDPYNADTKPCINPVPK